MKIIQKVAGWLARPGPTIGAQKGANTEPNREPKLDF